MSDSRIDSSICIVGAGPAGLALADRLAAAGQPVAVLCAEDDAPHDLLWAATPADPPTTVYGSRVHGVGGTARAWNHVHADARWAKFVPLDPIDFTSREWVPHSGWPFAASDLAPWIEEAYAVCGVVQPSAVPMSIDLPHPLRASSYVLGPAQQFRHTIPTRLAASPHVHLLRGRIATALPREANGRVLGVAWRAADGSTGVVRADTVVLAAGGIENARILLADRRARGAEPAAFDWLGRGFMEHPVDRSITIRSRDASLAHFTPVPEPGAPPRVPRLVPTSEYLIAERVPNFSVRFGGAEAGAGASSVAISPDIRSRLHRLIPSPRVRRALGQPLQAVRGLRRRWQGSLFQVLLDLEQFPSPDCRVVLSDHADALGRPVATLCWQWTDEEERQRRRVRRVVADALTALDLGRVLVNESVALDPRAHHHAGTTRMHDDPRSGVVDASLRVHGEENLYVVGSSVFPTAGVANPTLTLIALSARLAHHLCGA
jgi:choline dehydrogenase-like flavoprotein